MHKWAHDMNVAYTAMDASSTIIALAGTTITSNNLDPNDDLRNYKESTSHTAAVIFIYDIATSQPLAGTMINRTHLGSTLITGVYSIATTPSDS